MGFAGVSLVGAIQEITMVSQSGAVKALPSNLSPEGTSFSDRWVSSGP